MNDLPSEMTLQRRDGALGYLDRIFSAEASRFLRCTPLPFGSIIGIYKLADGDPQIDHRARMLRQQ